MAIVTGSNVCEITSVPGEVIQKSLDGYAPPLGRPVPYIRDLSRAERDFGFSATPVEEWMQTTVDRYREHYMGHDSQGHSARNQEVARAKSWCQARPVHRGVLNLNPQEI